ncbi:histidine kinase dimerization/phosphoacceptor domain -containing protein [Sulfuricurvum sp.]|uniref:sensor histidine kinase n=1 Tax=Sulfuricurvum sp. TaxID=2025608 RepID=UPI0025E37225|nr:histidine kinase dimerization/phosphoacceptor domain -containing protein [Sulfuricurvum sp.]
MLRWIEISNENRAKLQALGFAIVGVIGVAIVDRVSISLINPENDAFGLPFFIGVVFFILSAIFLYMLLRRTARIAEDALKKLAEEKETLQRFNFALDNSADAIYWFTFDTRFFYVNDAACTMLGYTKDELLNMRLNDIDPDYTKNTQDFLLQIREKQYICFESQQIRKDGSSFPVSVSASYFCDASKEFICAFGRDITEQKGRRRIIIEQNEALKNSLQDKEVLIKEIHHRVKNNLEVISSLLQMQSRRETNDQVKDALSKSQSRIYAIALVHEMLYQNSDLATINMKSHLERLSSAMIDLYAQNKNISVNLNAEDVYLSMDYAILIALIVHELFLNSIKHAFMHQNHGEIDIFIRNGTNGAIEFGVNDNGIGINPDKIKTSTSLGCELINTITEFQLNGAIVTDSSHGFNCTITFVPKERGNQ